MSGRAFLDANVVIYAAGAPHRYRSPCRAILQYAAEHRGLFVSSAEVLQEILNIGVRRGDLQYAANALERLVRGCRSIASVTAPDVFAAIDLDLPRLSARDRIHLAVMQRLQCSHIVTTDRAFDGLTGVTRLDPVGFDSWRDELAED